MDGELDRPLDRKKNNCINISIPMMGKLSLEGGIDSETTNINTASDRSTVISSDTFSPLSTGNIKVRAATADVSMHGNIIVRR